MSSSAAAALAQVSDSTAQVHSLAAMHLPFTPKDPVTEYLVAPSTSTAMLVDGVIVCGEFLMVRETATKWKVDSYIYGTRGGHTLFRGPHKGLPLHHVPSSCTLNAASQFGHNPWYPRHSR